MPVTVATFKTRRATKTQGPKSDHSYRDRDPQGPHSCDRRPVCHTNVQSNDTHTDRDPWGLQPDRDTPATIADAWTLGEQRSNDFWSPPGPLDPNL